MYLYNLKRKVRITVHLSSKMPASCLTRSFLDEAFNEGA